MRYNHTLKINMMLKIICKKYFEFFFETLQHPYVHNILLNIMGIKENQKNISRWIKRKVGKNVAPKQKRHRLVGPPKLWKMKRDFQISFLKEIGLKSKDYFLDIGCGTLRGGIPIIRYLEKSHYYGIDVRSYVLEEGKKELIESKLAYKEPVLISSKDLSSINLKKEFDYVWAFSVLVHLTDEMLEDCFMFVSHHLGKKGVIFANVNIGNRKKEARW